MILVAACAEFVGARGQFDLANNYGPPYGSAETNFGEHLRRNFKPYRDELIISSKAGWGMWPGPYGQGGGSRKYVSPAWTRACGALDTAVRQGKALYVGISSYSAAKTREAVAILQRLGTPLLIHQPSYSLLNRWIEEELLDTLQDTGVGCIAFSALARPEFTAEERAAIDQHAVDGDINRWKKPSTDQRP